MLPILPPLVHMRVSRTTFVRTSYRVQLASLDRGAESRPQEVL